MLSTFLRISVLYVVTSYEYCYIDLSTVPSQPYVIGHHGNKTATSLLCVCCNRTTFMIADRICGSYLWCY